MVARRNKPRLVAIADGTPLPRFLTYRLSQLGFRLNRQAAHLLRQESGLKLPEWRVLALLATHRQINAAGIEDLTGIDRGLLSRTVHALEGRGLVVARRSEEDRREVFVSITVAGRHVYKRQLPLMQARQAHLLEVLDPAERRLVFGIVDKLLDRGGGAPFRLTCPFAGGNSDATF